MRYDPASKPVPEERRTVLQREYWRFYWPLSVTGLALLLARQFQNGVLAHYDLPARELAVCARAMSTFHLFNAILIFLPQMINVFARSPHARRLCIRFTLTACAVLTAGLALTAYTKTGAVLLTRIYGIEADRLADVLLFLRIAMPLVIVNAMRQYYTGLLIQCRRTGFVTILNVVSMSTLVGMLLLGYRLGWRAVTNAAVAEVTAHSTYLVLAFVLYLRYYRTPEHPQHETLTCRKMLAFFWPLAITSSMFCISRPILYSFVGHTANAEEVIAALKVAFDFSLIFHSPLNQFRHLFVTFGLADLAGLRRFVTRVAVAMTLIMLCIVATPTGVWFLDDVLGVPEAVLARARQAIWVMCLVPMVISLRNYLHGLVMARQNTKAMALGAVLRNASLYTAARVLFAFGWLNHTMGAACLVLGFGFDCVAFLIVNLRRAMRVRRLVRMRKERYNRGLEAPK